MSTTSPAVDASPKSGAASSHLMGMSVRVWFRVLRENGFGVDAPFLLDGLSVTAASVLNSICRRIDDWRTPDTDPESTGDDPIFVVGHWRSGTTLLHNFLVADDRFATPDFCQALFPNSFLTAGKAIRWVLDRSLPKKRILDEMEIGPELPQEDELALCALTGLSPYVAYAFPRNWRHYNRYLTFADVPESEVRRWQEALRGYVRKLGRVYKKPLVLKSPPHTGRLQRLLEVFPKARFVHIHRNPYDVFQSSCRALAVVPPLLQMQRFDFSSLEDLVLKRYQMLYDAYLVQRPLVPAGQLHEIAFEDLTRDPIGEMALLYEKLRLPDFAAAEPALRAYTASLNGYRRNRYSALPEESARRVAACWARFFSEWNYPVVPAARAV